MSVPASAPAAVVVEHATREVSERYWDIVSEVFDEVDPERLRQGMTRFGPDTRIIAVEIGHSYASALFVTPIPLGGALFGGIGGVSTRSEYRGLGYGRRVLERALLETTSAYSALLLWTRIPEYFSGFGFVEVPEIFVPDPEGSSPMMFFHQEKSRSTVLGLRGLPRESF